MKVPIDLCEQRDPKGLYKKARAGQLKGFTGGLLGAWLWAHVWGARLQVSTCVNVWVDMVAWVSCMAA